MMETAIIVLVAVQTVFMAVLGAVLWAMSKRVQAATDEIREISRTVVPKTNEILAGVHRFVKSVEPVGEQLVDISISLKDVLEKAKETSGVVSDFMVDTTQMARRQVTQVDILMTEAVKQAEAAVAGISETLLNPVREVVAVSKGVRAAFRYLRGERPHPDRDKFSENDEMYL